MLKIIEIGLILEFLITSDIAALLLISKKILCCKGITPVLVEKGIVKGIRNNTVSNYSISRNMFKSDNFPLFPWDLTDLRQIYQVFKHIPCCFNLNEPFMPPLSYTGSLTTPYQQPVICKLLNDNTVDDSDEESQTMLEVFMRSYDGKVLSFLFQAYPSLIVEDELCDDEIDLLCHLPKDKDFCIETGLCDKCNRYRCSTCFDFNYCEDCSEHLCKNCSTCECCDFCENSYCSSCSDFTSCCKCENQCCDNCTDDFLHSCSHCQKILCETCLDNGLINFCEACDSFFCIDCIEHSVGSCDICHASYC